MGDQLNSIQTHLWVITILIGLFLALALLCNFMRISEGRDLKRMQNLMNAEKFSDLLVLTKQILKDQPGHANARIFQSMALFGLNRLDEARAVAEDLKTRSPLHFPEASALLDAIEHAQNEA